MRQYNERNNTLATIAIKGNDNMRERKREGEEHINI